MLQEFFAVMRGESDFMTLVITLLASLTIIFLILPLHELAHGFIAYKLGDPTAKLKGRLTFNPLAHIDPIGSALLVFFGFGWAKAVPVNLFYLKKPKRDMAIVALAGPLSNILAALVGGLLCNTFVFIALKNYDFFGSFPATNHIIYFFSYYISVNIVLAVFNLIPFPPLDGSRILSAFLPDGMYIKFLQYERYFFIALIVLMSTSAFDYIIDVPTGAIYDFIVWVTGLPFEPFL